MGEIHCEYCQCPIEIQKTSMKTYKGDECRLYDAFLDIIYEFGKGIKPFNNKDIINMCSSNFNKDFNDIENLEATVNEMIDINIDLGVMPDNYRPLYIIQKG